MAFKIKFMVNCSIGVCAYNEDKNIISHLRSLSAQQLKTVAITEIIVVASGCTDKTVELVKEYQAEEPRVKLIIQDKREGKSAAVNLFIKSALNQILILISADTLPKPETVEKLVSPFHDLKIGMAGGRPVPINSDKTFVGFCVNYMWCLHHLIALQTPKCGEMIVFRKVFEAIPASSAVDEACIEEKIKQNNLDIIYIPDAIITNKGPENIIDFLKQRRRIYSGHMALIKNSNYEVSTLGGGKILKLIIHNLPSSFKHKLWIPGMIFLEVWGRMLGAWDFYIKKKEPHIWNMAGSTKDLSR
ncbi:MAG: glycosyltransferase [Patescibacteria group bacterium]